MLKAGVLGAGHLGKMQMKLTEKRWKKNVVTTISKPWMHSLKQWIWLIS
jgi:hypothetical protein